MTLYTPTSPSRPTTYQLRLHPYPQDHPDHYIPTGPPGPLHIPTWPLHVYFTTTAWTIPTRPPIHPLDHRGSLHTNSTTVAPFIPTRPPWLPSYPLDHRGPSIPTGPPGLPPYPLDHRGSLHTKPTIAATSIPTRPLPPLQERYNNKCYFCYQISPALSTGYRKWNLKTKPKKINIFLLIERCTWYVYTT